MSAQGRANGAGDEARPQGRRNRSVLERFTEKYEVDPDTGCWIWTAGENGRGYGLMKYRGATRYAHRVSYLIFRGPLPASPLVIDHICNTPRCVNPEHLRPVTNRANILRGTSPTAANAAKQECVNGHPFTDENTYIRPDGNRTCRACNRACMVAYRARLKERAA